jgi:RNA polymerase sigma factor (sigma-70 family)
VDTLWTVGALGSRSDGELLDDFRRDPDRIGQEAFRILVERHGAMVLGVCRSLAGDPHDAEDAFQATFLVLIRRAESIRQRETIAPWLHGVACRVARKARIRSARRRRREVIIHVDPPACPRPDAELSTEHQALQEEIRQLPESLRAPLILCCLEGESYELAARRLGLRESTVRGRLHRARKRLEGRLRRRGLLAMGLAQLPEPGRLALPPSLIPSTTEFATRSARVGGLLVGVGSVPTSIITLAQGAINAMLIQTLKICGIATIVTVGLVGTLVVAQQSGTGTKAQATGSVAAGASRSQEPTTAPGKTGDRAQPIDPERRTRQILEKLEEPLSMSFANETPLDDFLKYIKQATTDAHFPGIPIYVDPVGMQEAGCNMDSRVVAFKTGNLGFVLGQALRTLRLSYLVKDGYLRISSRADVTEQRLEALDQKVDRLLKAMERLERANHDRPSPK